MDLILDSEAARGYTGATQRMRVLTESWVANNLFCPVCGHLYLTRYKANKPVADFFCKNCDSDFELKSMLNKSGSLGKRVVDGAYDTMVRRIASMHNPNFLFMTHDGSRVMNLIVIPKHFFTPELIERRKPLSESARWAGWIGCYINLEKIPSDGRIFIVRECRQVEHRKVLADFERIKTLYTKDLNKRALMMDIMSCMDMIPSRDLSLRQMYAFENVLKTKHPGNNFIRDKIRQQLQYLRDRGFIEFTSRGNYRKVKPAIFDNEAM